MMRLLNIRSILKVILFLHVTGLFISCSKKSDQGEVPPEESSVDQGKSPINSIPKASGSNSADISSITQVPSKTPTDLKAGVRTANSIEILWTDLATDELFYEVGFCQGVDCAEFQASSPLAANKTSYLQASLEPNTSYRFRVRTTNAYGSSAWAVSPNVMTQLSPLTNFAVTQLLNSVISIAWTAGSDSYTKVEIERCTELSCTSFRPVYGSPFDAPKTNHTEGGLAPESINRFRIRVLSEGTDSAWLESGNITTPAIVTPVISDPPIEPSPTQFTLNALSDSSVQFSWSDQSSQEFFYEVQRCLGLSCNNFSEAPGSPLAANSVSYSSSALIPETVYTFRVRAHGMNGPSAWLTGVEFKTAPKPPSALISNIVTAKSIQISWTDQSSEETAYEIERCMGSDCNNFMPVSSSPLVANSVTHTESNLTGLTTYRFQVRAVRASIKSSWLISSNITTLTEAASCASPSTVVIDKGLKSNTTNVGRGLYSDLKLIPGTRQAAIAYYDGSATGGTASIKLSWWNGSSFQVESVVGDNRVGVGSATWVRLAFLSNGKPMVFWTNGSTNVKGAVRSAALSSNGTWTAAVIDTVTGAATRALEVAVSPIDQVALIYLTNSTTAGRARFLHCNANCSILSNFVAMNAESDTIEASNVIASFMDTGVAWCKQDASTYYPAVVYPGSAATNIRYSSCRGALSTCRTAAGWTAQASNVVATTGVTAKLFLDSSIVGDTPKIVTRNAANTLLQAFEMNQACNASPAYSFTAGNTFGAAGSGTAWLDLLKSSTGYHVIANLGATNINYHNSVSSVFSTTAWNSAGVVDTLTLPAPGAGVGGADLNALDSQIYTSYGGAAAPFHINMGVVADITSASSSASSVYYTYLPDLSGGIQLGLTTGQTRNISTASTSDGRVAVAYVDFSVGASVGAVLKYAFQDDFGASSPWMYWTLPNTSSPMFPSLAFDNNDRPWISYYDGATFRYFLATNSASDGSGDWTFYQFPINGKTATATAPARDDTAVEMLYSQGVASPLMLVMNSTAAGGTGVRAALFDRTLGAFTGYSTVDLLGASYATRLAADFDKKGNIVVSYYDLTLQKVRFNYTTNGLTWLGVGPQITALNAGREGLSIALNPATAKPAISYYDRSNNAVYYTACNSALASCSSSSNWLSSTLDSSLGISGISVNNEQLLNSSLTFSAEGKAYVTYMSGISATLQGYGVTDNTSGSFVTTNLGSNASAAVAGASSMNFAMTGWSVSSTRTVNGSLFSAYVGPNNWLYATFCQ